MSYSKLIKAGILSLGLSVLVSVSSPAATVYDSNGNKVNGIEEVSSSDHKKTFKCEKGLSYLLEGVADLKGADSSKVKYEDNTIKVLDYCEFSVILESGDVYEFKCEAPTEPVIEKPAEEPKEEVKEPPVEPVVEDPPVEEPQPAEEVQQVVEAPQETQQEPTVEESDDTPAEEELQETLPTDEQVESVEEPEGIQDELTTEETTEVDTEATTEADTEADTEAITEVTTESSTEAIEESTVESEVSTVETEVSTEVETEPESEESNIVAPVEEQVPFEHHEVNVELPTTTDTESSSVIHDVSGIHKQEPKEQPRTPIAPPVVDSDKADLSNTIIDSVQGITPEETENKEDNPYSLKKEDLILFQELEKEKEQNSVTVLVKNIDTEDLANSAETIMTIISTPQQDTDSVSEQIVKGIESNIEEPVGTTENTKIEEKETEVTVEVPETEVIEDSFEKEEPEETSEFTVVEETEEEETEASTEVVEETEEVKESEIEAVETEEVKETEPETPVETEQATEAETEPVVDEPTTEAQETEPTESLLPDVKPSDDASSIITKLDIKVEETEEDAPIDDEFIDKSQSDEILNVIGAHSKEESAGYNTLDVETVKLDSEIDIEQGLAAASVINNAKLSEEKHIGYKGQTFHLNVLNGSVDNIKSSNDAIASINSDGTISLNKVGKATVTVESNGKTMSCDVLCANPEFDDSFINIEDKGEYQLEVKGNLQGQKPKFTLLTKNVEGASLTKDGLLTVPTGKRVKVRVEICGKKFTKTIQAETKAQTKWKGMQEAIEYCLGTPYVLGGFTPKVALDCSGYCSYVYNTVGLMSGRTTAQGLYNMCKKTDKPEPGDLVFFQGTYNCGDFITHVGLYAGDGMMYHSGSPNKKVAITGYYQQHFVSYGTMTH